MILTVSSLKCCVHRGRNGQMWALVYRRGHEEQAHAQIVSWLTNDDLDFYTDDARAMVRAIRNDMRADYRNSNRKTAPGAGKGSSL